MSDARTLPLLLEVGCEEIPARFLAQAQKDLGDHLGAALGEARLVPLAVAGPVPEPSPEARVQTYSTPRRLVAHIAAVLDRQPDVTEEVTGPPVRIAFDAEGKPTRAAESFAAKNGVTVEDLLKLETPKGFYLVAKKATKGLPALEVLSGILPQVIKSLSFPKSMVWEATGVRFVRPIRWIVALLGEGESAQVIPFEIAGVTSGSVTRLHRLARKPEVVLTGFKDYVSKLRRGHVEIDSKVRCRKIRTGIKSLLESEYSDGPPAEHAAMRLVPDPGLEDWIVNSTEWPRAVLGSFDRRFLELPREILITVMRNHQKYFAVEEATASAGAEPSVPSENKLAPQFVTVLNVPVDPEGIIRRGHERVLAARLEDAKFFWDADQRVSLRERYEKGWLDKVTYHERLGSYGDKAGRVAQVGHSISAVLFNQKQLTEAGQEFVRRAAQLCKCDLTTQMVQEFTELQGIVGGLYAKTQGESKEVWQAIYDHYRPQGLEDRCPLNLVGAVVALADKIDAVAAGFIAGFAPTGSSDPFGLRRQANGVVKILLHFSISVNLRPLVLEVINLASVHEPELYVQTPKAQSLAGGIVQFFRERVGSYLEEGEALGYDVVRAALGARDVSPSGQAQNDDPLSIAQRARACALVRTSEGFLSLCAAAKRIRNILAKSADGPDSLGSAFKADLFKSEQETTLGQAISVVETHAQQFAARGEFAAALLEVAKLAEPVDRFFDAVLVMDPDTLVRENRLRLLNRLNAIFSAVVDLSQVMVD